MKPRILVPLVSVLILTASCNKVSFNKLDAVVEDNLVVFPETEIPLALASLIESKQIIVLGETHYVEEHHAYISLLLDQYGPEGLCFINEFSNAYNWMVEDYLAGAIQHVPYTIRLINQTWLEKLREINLSAETGTPVKFYFMDVNQWKDDFKTSIRESEKILGEQSIFALIKILDVDRNAYLYELEDLKEMLEIQELKYREEWGEKWYKRYLDLISLELESCRYRRSPDETMRELFMLDMIQNTLSKEPQLKALINCEMYHAQKETMMGADIQRLRALLESQSSYSMASIAFTGIKGKRKYKFDNEGEISFNMLENTAEDNLMHIIGQKAGDHMSLLLLDHEIFREEMNVSYTGGALRVAPGRQFDVLITYPEISILKSLTDFGYL